MNKSDGPCCKHAQPPTCVVFAIWLKLQGSWPSAAGCYTHSLSPCPNLSRVTNSKLFGSQMKFMLCLHLSIMGHEYVFRACSKLPMCTCAHSSAHQLPFIFCHSLPADGVLSVSYFLPPMLTLLMQGDAFGVPLSMPTLHYPSL